MSDKTVAKRLREIANNGRRCEMIAEASGKECEDFTVCAECARAALTTIANQIEAEQAELREKVELAHALTKGAMHQLPEGVIWPRFEDGELVKFGDVTGEERLQGGAVDSVTVERNGAFRLESGKRFAWYCAGDTVKRPEPEVLDADGVPIKVGDTVYDSKYEFKVTRITEDGLLIFNNPALAHYPDDYTHRKPDTQEDIDEDCWLDAKDYCEKHNVKTEWPKHYGKAKCEHLLARQRKLLGGE